MRRSILMLSLLAYPALAAEPQIIGAPGGKDVVTIRVPEASQSKQKLPFFPGVSTKNAGSQHLSLLKVVIPPGGSAQAHIHKGYETAIYLLQGRVETHYGEKLEKSIVNVAGDFIYIPADVPHQPVNISQNEPAIAIVARNDGDEQEHVVIVPNKERAPPKD